MLSEYDKQASSRYELVELFHWLTQQPSQANTHQNEILQKDLDLLCDWEAK